MSPSTNGASSLEGLNVLFVLPTLGLAGAERQAFLLARHLKTTHRARVHLLSFNTIATMAPRCQAEDLPYSFFELRHAAGSRFGHFNDLRRFVSLLRHMRVDILMPYCMFQNVLCGLTWRVGGARLCVWNQRDEGRSRVARWIERLAVQQMPRFVSNSSHGAEFLTASLGVPAERVTTVLNGVELPAPGSPRRDWRSELGIPSGALIACMAANLHSNKDHATLVAAWRQVVDRWPGSCPPHLLLAGEFRDRYAALVEQVQALGISALVHFLGPVAEIDDLLRAVDFIVFSSFKEGVPNAVLEAMAYERAVVATDYVGIREAVGVEGAQLLAAPGDPVAFADKVLSVATDAELRRRMGEYGRRRVDQAFGIDRMSEQMTDILLTEWRSRNRP